MNSDKNHNHLSRTVIADADNYVGRFVKHYLHSVIEDADENLFTLNNEACLPSNLTLLAWCSLSPTKERAEEIEQSLGDRFPSAVVMLSSSAVYALNDGENINELTPADPSSPFTQAENAMTDICRRHNAILTILRLPLLVVGTDMDGILMNMVRQIFRGTYYDIRDNDARVSLIHASSVGEAIALSAGHPGTFNINDNTSTTVATLANALSYRIGHKKPFTLTLSAARRIASLADLIGWHGQGRDMLRFKTTTLTFSAERFTSEFNFHPIAATDYLMNHVYDEASL